VTKPKDARAETEAKQSAALRPSSVISARLRQPQLQQQEYRQTSRSDAAARLRQRQSDTAPTDEDLQRLHGTPAAGARLSTRSGFPAYPQPDEFIRPALNLSKILIPSVVRRQLPLLNMSPSETWTTGFLDPIFLQTCSLGATAIIRHTNQPLG